MISQYNSLKIKVLSLVAALMVVQIPSCYGVGMSSLGGKLYKIFMVEGVYGFAVPFFFIVSGYFFMNRYDGSMRWWINGISKRAKSLLLPYVVWVILYICIVRFSFGDFTTMQQDFKGKRKDSALGGFSAQNASFAG